MIDSNDRSHRETGLEVREPRRPPGGGLVGDHDQWAAGVLGLVPGMENLFFVALFRLVEESAPNALGETAGERCSTGPARTGEDGRFDRPHAPLAKMVECRAIGVRNDEAGIPFALGPVERKRDLVRPLFHSGAFGGVAACGCAGVGWGCAGT